MAVFLDIGAFNKVKLSAISGALARLNVQDTQAGHCIIRKHARRIDLEQPVEMRTRLFFTYCAHAQHSSKEKTAPGCLLHGGSR